MTDTVPLFDTAADTSVGEPFCTSGTSPTTIHLVGPGQVGQAFLRLLPDTSFRLVGITDTSATLHAASCGLQGEIVDAGGDLNSF